MRVLIIEDDDQTADYMRKGLSESGHVVDRSDNGRDGLYMASSGEYDAVILDRMLPGLEGLKVLEALRAANIQTPVLILSALGQVDDLTKPFAFSELLARLESMTRRRAGSAPETTLTVGDLTLDRLSRKVVRAGQGIDLQPREFQLLEFLMRHAGQVVTRTMLLEGVWDYHFDPQTNVIDVHMSRLRQKVDKGFDPALIRTVRGAGYLLSAED